MLCCAVLYCTAPTNPNGVTQQPAPTFCHCHRVQSQVRPRKWSSPNLKSSLMLCYHVKVQCDTLPDSLHHTPHLILPIMTLWTLLNIIWRHVYCVFQWWSLKLYIYATELWLLARWGVSWWAGPNWYRWYLHKLDTPLVVDLQLASCLLQLPASIKTTFDINSVIKGSTTSTLLVASPCWKCS